MLNLKEFANNLLGSTQPTLKSPSLVSELFDFELSEVELSDQDLMAVIGGVQSPPVLEAPNPDIVKCGLCQFFCSVQQGGLGECDSNGVCVCKKQE